MAVVNEIFEILGDPAHWVAEVVMDGTIALLVLYPFRVWLKRHDERKHAHPVTVTLGPPSPAEDAVTKSYIDDDYDYRGQGLFDR